MTLNGDIQKINPKFTQQQVEQILYDLRLPHPESKAAFIFFQNKIYFSLFRPLQNCPSSATVKLIQGIFDQNTDLSFFILRQRIFTNEEISPMISGMVDLAAKRISQYQAVNHNLKINFVTVEVGDWEVPIYTSKALLQGVDVAIPQFVRSHSEAMELAQTLARSVPQGLIKHDFNRPIGALIVDAEGKILSGSVNSAALNKTLHAEVRALQRYYSENNSGLPPGCRIYVTLKPCRMCAGMMATTIKSLEVSMVYYANDDLGPKAQRTAMEPYLVHYPID